MGDSPGLKTLQNKCSNSLSHFCKSRKKHQLMSESDSIFTLLSTCLLSEAISEKSRPKEHNQQPLKSKISDLGVKK